MKGGSLLPEYREAWARHFVLFAKALADEGVPLWGTTVQNEPEAVTAWETCFFSDTGERDFVRDFLGPALRDAGLLDLKIIVWDHNRDHMYKRAAAVYGDPAAARFVWGLAFHWYQGNFSNVQRTHQLRPDKHLIFTEGCQEGGPHIGSWMCGERYGKNIIMDLNNWTEAWIDWNLVLNEHGGPNHAGNMCSAPIMVDFQKGRLMFQPSYYFLGHFSRYVRPGAVHITCKSGCKGLIATSFMNVDGTVAVVVMNDSLKDVDFWLVVGQVAAKVQAPSHSISTLLLLVGDAYKGIEPSAYAV